jgi:PQQ-like domain
MPPPAPDAGAVPTIVWPGLTGGAVRQLPDPQPLAGAGLPAPYIGGDIHHLHATDSSDAHYFNYRSSADGGSQKGFMKVAADWSLAWQVTIPDSLFVNHNASANGKGEVAIIGTINQTTSRASAYTAKYGADGKLAWSAQFQYPSNAYTQGIVTSIAADGSVVSAGFVNGGANDYITALTRYAADGTPLWTKGYCEGFDGDAPESIVTDSAGNIYFSIDNSVFALSADGTPLFSSTLPPGTIYSLSLSADEGALFGYSAPLPVGDRSVVTKIDAKTGAIAWTAHFATSTGLIQLSDFLVSAEGLYMIGELADTHQFCARFDEQGNQLWFEECAGFSHGAAVNGYFGALVFFDSRGGRTTDGGVPDAGGDGGGAGGGSMVILTPELGAWRVGTDGTPLSF